MCSVVGQVPVRSGQLLGCEQEAGYAAERKSSTRMSYIVETPEQAKSHGDKLEDTLKLAKQVLDLSQQHPCDVQTGQAQPLGL